MPGGSSAVPEPMGGGGDGLPQVPYPPGRGLALLFADENEGERFLGQRSAAARALAQYDFEVRVFGAKSMLQDTKSALAGFSSSSHDKSVLFWYVGHGGRSDSCSSEGFLCGHGGGCGEHAVDVKTLLFEVNRAVPRGTPTLFILDCCSSDSSHAPPVLQVEPGAPQPHDCAFLRSSSDGFYGYTVGGKGVTQFLSEALDDVAPGGSVDWNNLSDLIAPAMASFMGGKVEPRQTNLTSGKHFCLRKTGSWKEERDKLRQLERRVAELERRAAEAGEGGGGHSEGPQLRFFHGSPGAVAGHALHSFFLHEPGTNLPNARWDTHNADGFCTHYRKLEGKAYECLGHETPMLSFHGTGAKEAHWAPLHSFWHYPSAAALPGPLWDCHDHDKFCSNRHLDFEPPPADLCPPGSDYIWYGNSSVSSDNKSWNLSYTFTDSAGNKLPQHVEVKQRHLYGRFKCLGHEQDMLAFHGTTRKEGFSDELHSFWLQVPGKALPSPKWDTYSCDAFCNNYKACGNNKFVCLGHKRGCGK